MGRFDDDGFSDLSDRKKDYDHLGRLNILMLDDLELAAAGDPM